MDINANKLSRIVSHLENDGVASPDAIAKILRAKPENTGYLRSYVQAACEQLKDQTALEEFNSMVGLLADAKEPDSEKSPAIVAEQPSPEVQPQKSGKEKPTLQTESDSTSYVLLDENGLLKTLEVKTKTASKIIFAVAKEKKEVKVILRGQEVVLDLLNLEPVTVGDVTFSVEQLHPIATAASL